MFKVGQLHLSLFSYLLMNYSFICKYFLKNNTMRISLEKKKKPWESYKYEKQVSLM